MSVLKDMLGPLSRGEPLDAPTAQAAFACLMDGEANDAETAAFLMALKVRGETPVEIAAGARALRARAVRVAAPEDVVDTCGTGGDGLDTVNISTAAALVAAGAGARVAKHGNRAVSSKSGSSDVLAALGVNIEAGPDVAARAIAEAGVGFLFAPAHHSAMRHVAPVRQALGLRTVFNLIGPLTNPAGARRQILGVYDRTLLRPMAEALVALGAERALVVHGADGLDEITTTDVTHAVILEDGALREETLTPEALGVARARPEDLAGGDAQDNALIIRAVLAGAGGPVSEIIAINAAGALWAAGRVRTLQDGLALARDAIATGSAKAALARLVAITNAD